MLPRLGSFTIIMANNENKILDHICLFVFLALQPTVVVISQPGSGL